MPVTPLRLGVGMAAKGLCPRGVSLAAFALSQVAVDVEVAYSLLLRQEYPFHRRAHTFLGGAAIAILAAAVVVACGRVVRALAGGRWRVPDLREASWSPALAGGLLGGLTHPVLDGVVHEDVAPLRPFSAARPFYEAVGITALNIHQG